MSKSECIIFYDKQDYRIIEIPINEDKPKALTKKNWNNEPTNLKIGKDNLFAVIQEDEKLVIDIDNPDFNYLLEEYLDKTLVVKTGNDGRHAYFKDQTRTEEYRIKTTKLYYGDKQIGDIKAHMSYVVGCGGSYFDKEDSKTKTYTKISSVDTILKTDCYDVLKILKEHGVTTKKVKVVKKNSFESGLKVGERNNECFKIACSLFEKPNATFEYGLSFIKTYNSTQKTPLDNSEIETIVKSAWERVQKKEDEINLNHVRDFVLSRNDFLTINDKNRDLHIYENGVHKIGGESTIDKEIEMFFQDESTNNFRREVLEKIKIHTLINREEIDKDDNIINCPSGLYDLEKGTLRPHSANYKSIVQWNFIYDEKANCPKIFKFLNDVILEEKERRTVLEMMSELLWKKSTLSKSYFLLGKGGNGKTILRDIIIGIVGETNISGLGFEDFADKYKPADLYGKIANIPDEIDDTKIIKSAIWKTVTAKKSILAQRKYGQPFNFIPYAKNIMPCNRPPTIDDKSDGTYRRIVPIHFNQTFTHRLTPELKKLGYKKADDEFTDSLLEEKEISGLFNTLVKILKELKNRKHLTYGLTIDEVRTEWETLADTTKEYVFDMLDEDPDGTALKTDFYRNYVKFCQMKHYKPDGINTFYANFQKEGAVETRKRINPKDKNAKQCFTGFWFKNTPKEKTKDKEQTVFKEKNE